MRADLGQHGVLLLDPLLSQQLLRDGGEGQHLDAVDELHVAAEPGPVVHLVITNQRRVLRPPLHQSQLTLVDHTMPTALLSEKGAG